MDELRDTFTYSLLADFSKLSPSDLAHLFTTLRRDATGEIDRALSQQNLERHIHLTTPHMLVLPFVIASSNLVAAVPYRIALSLAGACRLSIFELPIQTKPWMVSMLWSTLSDQDEANCWLRHLIKTIAQKTGAN